MRLALQVTELNFLDWEPVNLALQPGEVIGVSGVSGSGKSLLLRAIADLDVHSGGARLDGVDRDSIPAPEWRRRVAMLPAEPRWWLGSVGEHFHTESADLVGRLGFGVEVFGWEIARLSVGERQRLALARLFDRQPEVLLLDEPTANLDGEATRLVEQLVLESGLAPIWVSHDVDQLARVGRRQFVMAERRLREVGR